MPRAGARPHRIRHHAGRRLSWIGSGPSWGRFVLRTAARELRAEWARLWLVTAASALGLGAFITTAGFGDSVREALRDNARELLGADVVVSSVRPLDAQFTARLSRQDGVEAHARVTDTVVMVATDARPSPSGSAGPCGSASRLRATAMTTAGSGSVGG